MVQRWAVYIPDVLQPARVFNRWMPSLLWLLKRICTKSQQSKHRRTLEMYRNHVQGLLTKSANIKICCPYRSKVHFHFILNLTLFNILQQQPEGFYDNVGSPTTQICLTLIKALWMSWRFGRLLSRSNLMTSLNCGWLFVMAVKILRVAMIATPKFKMFNFILVVLELTVQKWSVVLLLINFPLL